MQFGESWFRRAAGYQHAVPAAAFVARHARFGDRRYVRLGRHALRRGDGNRAQAVGNVVEMVPNIRLVCPAMVSANAGQVPLYGMWFILMLVM